MSESTSAPSPDAPADPPDNTRGPDNARVDITPREAAESRLKADKAKTIVARVVDLTAEAAQPPVQPAPAAPPPPARPQVPAPPPAAPKQSAPPPAPKPAPKPAPPTPKPPPPPPAKEKKAVANPPAKAKQPAPPPAKAAANPLAKAGAAPPAKLVPKNELTKAAPPSPPKDIVINAVGAIAPTPPPKPQRRFRLAFLLFVILPSMAAAWYYHRVATPMYISELNLAVVQGNKTLTSDIAVLLGTQTNTIHEVQVIMTSIHTQDMLDTLDKELGLRKHYSNPDADFLSRLPDNATAEEFLEYWKWALKAEINGTTGLLVFRIKAFSPVMARSIASALMAHCEVLVNNMNQRSKAVNLARWVEEMEKAKKNWQDAMDVLHAFGIKHETPSLKESLSSRTRFIHQLEAQLVKANAELAAKRKFYNPTHVEIITLEATIEATANEVKKQQQEMVKEVKLIAEYAQLEAKVQFTERAFNAASSAYEAARIQVDLQTVFVSPISRPSLPEESLYPRRLLYTLTFFAVNLVLYGFLSLVAAAIRDHAGV